MERPIRRQGAGRKVPILIGMVVIGTVAVVASSVPGVGKTVTGLFMSTNSDIVTYKTTKAKLAVTVVERGNLESAKNDDVFNEVEGQTTIIKILPEGTRVKKGDEVCQLDSATLRDNLTNQEIQTKRAEADYQNAIKTREVAQIAVKEYVQGTFPQEVQTIEGEMKLAESDLKRSIDRLAWSEQMLRSKYVSESQVLADRMSQQKAEISLLNSRKKKEVLEVFTKIKQITEFEANVKKAESDELAKKATYELEKSKEEKLGKQIIKCKLFAPNDGLVVYANETNQFRGGSNAPLIEEGATVRERQKIFSLPDIAHMQVNTKVHESMIDRVTPGLRARIRVDAFPNNLLTGTVKSVQPLPDPSSFFSSDIKVYTTLITIDNALTGLRPGMTAQVEVLITQLDNVVAVPVQAVLEFQGKDHVYVTSPDGPRRREVKLGLTNDKLIEVKEGVRVGDDVILNPSNLLSEQEKREVFAATTKSTGKGKDWGNVPASQMSPGLATGVGKAAVPGAAGEGKAAAKKKGGRGGGGMFGGDPAMGELMKKVPQEDRRAMFTGSAEERAEILKKAGATPAQIQQLEESMRQMRERMQQGGGFPGGGGGGGFGGGPPGGGPQ